MDKVDVCVVSYNSLDDLRKFLYTLQSGPQPKVWKLYIADNGSTDGTVEWLRENGSRMGAERIDYNDNIGYARACNKLASYGDSRFIALCNADTWMTGFDVFNMTRSFNETDADILGPKQRDEHGRITHGGIFGSNTAPRFRGWQVSDVFDKKFRDRDYAVTVSGSAYFIKRKVWNALTNDSGYQKIAPGAEGAFLPTFFYYEETFCSYLARHRGYKIMYDGSVSIGHKWHGSHPKNDYLDTQVAHQSRAMFRQACDRLGIPRD